MPRLDASVEAAIREALADPAASYVSIAEKVGRHADTVRYQAIRWGLERDSRTLTDEQQEKIRRMLRAGCWTHRQIAKGVGCSLGTVGLEAQKLGINREDRMPSQLQKGDD